MALVPVLLGYGGLGCAAAKLPVIKDPKAILSITRVVVEDPNGVPLAHYGNFPGIADHFTQREASEDGIQIVRGFSSPEIEKGILAVLNDALARNGYPPLSRREFRKAREARQLTCHEVGHSPGGVFGSVGFRVCGRALVFVVRPPSVGEPLAEQIGFEDPPRRRDLHGMLPVASVPEPALLPVTREVSWEELLPYLKAAMRAETIPIKGGTKISAKICMENLAVLGEGAMRSPLGRAAVRALNRLDDAGGRWIFTPYLGDRNFPERVMRHPRIRELLSPHLQAEGVRLTSETAPVVRTGTGSAE
ncbi:MAG: hypothetical protein HY436_00820 [Candidatus Liptonbacteria bacterium]|nr:hypothetical protein [Candidatus Liptonbacteria bacterium]